MHAYAGGSNGQHIALQEGRGQGAAPKWGVGMAPRERTARLKPGGRLGGATKLLGFLSRPPQPRIAVWRCRGRGEGRKGRKGRKYRAEAVLGRRSEGQGFCQGSSVAGKRREVLLRKLMASTDVGRPEGAEGGAGSHVMVIDGRTESFQPNPFRTRRFWWKEEGRGRKDGTSPGLPGHGSGPFRPLGSEGRRVGEGRQKWVEFCREGWKGREGTEDFCIAAPGYDFACSRACVVCG